MTNKLHQALALLNAGPEHAGEAAELLRDGIAETHDAEQRAEQAEAENERLRKMGIRTAASLAAAISLLERGGKEAAASNRMFRQMIADYNKTLEQSREALVTPPEGDEYSIRCVVCDASVDPDDGGLCDDHKYDEQRKGELPQQPEDALAAWDRIKDRDTYDPLTQLEIMREKAAREGVGIAHQYNVIRHHLKASAVPEEVRRLPSSWRSNPAEDLPVGSKEQQSYKDACDDCATELERALESAPAVADGWKLVPVKSTPEMNRAADMTSDPWDVWERMLAAAPTKGGAE